MPEHRKKKKYHLNRCEESIRKTINYSDIILADSEYKEFPYLAARIIVGGETIEAFQIK